MSFIARMLTDYSYDTLVMLLNTSMVHLKNFLTRKLMMVYSDTTYCYCENGLGFVK